MIQIAFIRLFNNRFPVNITEQGDFIFHFFGNGHFRPDDDDIRLDAEAAQFFYAVLSRLCFHFAGRFQIGNQVYSECTCSYGGRRRF